MSKDSETERALREFAHSARGQQVRTAVAMPCPDPKVLTSLLAEVRIPNEGSRAIARHALGCPICARQLAARAPDQHASHPSAAVRRWFATGRNPGGRQGQILQDRTRAHVEACEVCATQAQVFRGPVLQLTEHGADPRSKGLLKGLVQSLAAMAYMQDAALRWLVGPMNAMAEAKRTGGVVIEALVLDAGGAVALDTHGEALTVAFDLTKARIDRERGVEIALITRERLLVEHHVPAVVEVMLTTPEGSVRFPPQPLIRPKRSTPYPAVGVSFRQKFPAVVDIPVLPAAALHLTVTCPDLREEAIA